MTQKYTTAQQYKKLTWVERKQTHSLSRNVALNKKGEKKNSGREIRKKSGKLKERKGQEYLNNNLCTGVKHETLKTKCTKMLMSLLKFKS